MYLAFSMFRSETYRHFIHQHKMGWIESWTHRNGNLDGYKWFRLKKKKQRTDCSLGLAPLIARGLRSYPLSVPIRYGVTVEPSSPGIFRLVFSQGRVLIRCQFWPFHGEKRLKIHYHWVLEYEIHPLMTSFTDHNWLFTKYNWLSMAINYELTTIGHFIRMHGYY